MENLKLSATTLEVLKAFKSVKTATANELKNSGIEKINSSHLVSLKNNGLIEQLSDKKIVVCGECGTKKTYTNYKITELGELYNQ